MRVAIVGCGSIGARYLDWIRDLGYEVAGCDASAARRDWIANEAYAVPLSTVDEVINWGADRVLIATPPDQHEAVSLPLLDREMPLLIEKPLAHTLDSARRIEAVAMESGAPTAVVCNMRFHKGVRAIRDNLHRIGRPLSFRGVFGHRLSQMRERGGDFARSREAGGGVVLDCIHEFDYLRWLLGPIAEVRSTVAHLGPDVIDAEDLAEVTLMLENGVIGSLHLDLLMRQKRRGLELIGEDGSLMWTSTGRAPEMCQVTFTDQNHEELLVEDRDLDPRLEYEGMLQQFLGEDWSGLQTVAEAAVALETAMEAREGR